MNIVADKWDEILQIIRMNLDLMEISYNTWLKPLTVYSLENNIVTIVVPSGQIAINYLNKNYKSTLQVTISEVTGIDNCEIRFVSPDNLPEKKTTNENEAPQKKLKKEIRMADGTLLIPDYTFDTFVVGSNNKLAQAAALAVAESPGNTYNPLFIYGGAGLGKTHLMHSIAHFIVEHNPDSKVLYVTSEDFTNEVIDSIRSGSHTAMSSFREKYRNIDVLLVDDIQFIIGKDSTQEEFFHTFNSLHDARKQIVISSDKPPKEMEILDSRFRSRFNWGLITDISAPDYETRVAILHKKEEVDGYEISEDVITYIADNVKSNIRELEGALNRVIAFARLNQQEIDLNLTEQALKDIIYTDTVKEITPEYIISTVADHFHISAEDMKGNKRNARIVFPRQISMYLCKEMLTISLKQIGEYLGGKDHSTVLNGINRISESINTNAETRNTVDSIRKKINPNQ